MNTRRIAALTAVAVTSLTTVTGVVGFGISQSNATSSSTACTISSTPTLKYGSKGSHVKALQCVLKQNGANLVGDGIFGPKTRAAVRTFQSANGLVVDGIVGPKTWAALKQHNGGGSGGGGGSTDTSAARQEVLNRAKTWLTAKGGGPVPYSQGKTYQGYRTDCSGYASMALQLGKPGLNTVGLAGSNVTRKISMSELKPGDLVIDADGDNNTRHVVIFEKWNDSGHSSYTAYEQAGGGGTKHRTQKYGISGKDQYKAYRPLKFND